MSALALVARTALRGSSRFSYGQVLQPAVSEVQRAAVVEVQSGVLHVRFEQSELTWQVTSHAHARPQVTVRHDPLPMQSTLHGPVPQLMFRQLCAPLHVIVHA